MNIIINKIGKNPGLRKTAKTLKQKVLESVASNTPVVIDFTDVESVSSSFADELIGKLYIQIGAETFKKMVKMINVNDDIKLIIKIAIKDRLSEVA